MGNYYDIQIDQKSDLPYYIQIFQAIKEMILSQEVAPHSKLPPIRKLATALHVNNGTIVSAYKQLEIQDLVYSKPGSGTYIAAERTPEVEPAAYSFSRIFSRSKPTRISSTSS